MRAYLRSCVRACVRARVCMCVCTGRGPGLHRAQCTCACVCARAYVRARAGGHVGVRMCVRVSAAGAPTQASEEFHMLTLCVQATLFQGGALSDLSPAHLSRGALFDLAFRLETLYLLYLPGAMSSPDFKFGGALFDLSHPRLWKPLLSLLLYSPQSGELSRLLNSEMLCSTSLTRDSENHCYRCYTVPKAAANSELSHNYFWSTEFSHSQRGKVLGSHLRMGLE